MKTKRLLVCLILNVACACTAWGQLGSERLRQRASAAGANISYRFANDSETASFVIIVLLQSPTGTEAKGPQVIAFDNVTAFPVRGSVSCDEWRLGKIFHKERNLTKKEISDFVYAVGYSEFFSVHGDGAVDPRREYLDGRFLIGERQVGDRYMMRQGSAEEVVTCRWLYDYLLKFLKNV